MKKLSFSIRIFPTLFFSRLTRWRFDFPNRPAHSLTLFSVFTIFTSAAMAQTINVADPAIEISSSVIRSLRQQLIDSGFDGGVMPDVGLDSSEATVGKGNSPVVAIVGGDITVLDRDRIPGELVAFSGTVTVGSGTIVKTEWLIDDTVVATGITPTITLNDGTTEISFKATDDDGASSTASVTYTVGPPASQLPRINGINSQQMRRASDFSIAVRDSNNFIVSIAPITQIFDISGFIYPQSVDAFSTADIFVVAATPQGWLMRTVNGSFVPWNGDFASLVPAYEDQRLTKPLRVTMYTGRLLVPGNYALFLAYMRTDSGELIYNEDPRMLSVTGQ
jgi:hypothetical protein